MASNDPGATEAPEGGEAPGEASLLVSEFPPPPFYYRKAANMNSNSNNTHGGAGGGLRPPPIPGEALTRGTKRAAAAAARSRAESERLRLGQDDGADKTDAILGGVQAAADEDEEGAGDVVAVFGEIVEDPMLVEPADPCDDPTVVRDEVRRLNNQVLQGFVKLVKDLVYKPMENKKTRDELSHNIFLMLQECNKFREHQAREVLIELLEKQLIQRRALLEQLQTSTAAAEELLHGDT